LQSNAGVIVISRFVMPYVLGECHLLICEATRGKFSSSYLLLSA